LRSRKTQLGQINLVDEGVDRTDRILFRNPVLKLLWKQNPLRPLFPLDESAHPPLRQVDLPTPTTETSKSFFAQPRPIAARHVL
jgi:hypothetical protein